MKITLKQEKALNELIATCRAVVAESVFPKRASEEITEATNIVEELVFNSDVDNTDWEEIQRTHDALFNFGKETA